MNAAVAEVVSISGARPFFKAAGGKRQLLPELRQHVPEKFGRYFEPFAGGASLFFGIAPRRAALNDLNPHMMAAYKAVRDDVEGLIRALQFYVRGHVGRGAEDFYYKCRDLQLDPKDQVRAAAWFLFLNRAGWNGLWRVNKKGEFNVPHGKWVTPPMICNAPVLRSTHAALQGVRLTCGDFEKVGSLDVKKGDFWYADCPYVPVSADSDFTAYTKEPFGSAEQERLRDLALRLKRKGVHILLSNSDTPLVRKLYAKGFEKRRVEARRAINSKIEKRGTVGELIIS